MVLDKYYLKEHKELYQYKTYLKSHYPPDNTNRFDYHYSSLQRFCNYYKYHPKDWEHCQAGKCNFLAPASSPLATGFTFILIFAAFAKPAQGSTGLWPAIFAAKWYITAGLLIILGFMLKAWFIKEERVTWVQSTWGFMKQIFPLLGAGVLVAGFMLGSFFF